jgi:hypothetical protein
MLHNFTALFLCALLSSAYAQPLTTVKAAGLADSTLVLYFEATYAPPLAAGQNLRVEKAKVTMVMASDSIDKPKLMHLDCTNDESILARYQDTAYGRGSQGKVIGMSCSPDTQFIFLLFKEASKEVGLNCGHSAMLGTQPAAWAASFGHQAFCMEDWTLVKNPVAQLQSKFKTANRKK